MIRSTTRLRTSLGKDNRGRWSAARNWRCSSALTRAFGKRARSRSVPSPVPLARRLPSLKASPRGRPKGPCHPYGATPRKPSEMSPETDGYKDFSGYCSPPSSMTIEVDRWPRYFSKSGVSDGAALQTLVMLAVNHGFPRPVPNSSGDTRLR
jgi:hypothetical protein